MQHISLYLRLVWSLFSKKKSGAKQTVGTALPLHWLLPLVFLVWAACSPAKLVKAPDRWFHAAAVEVLEPVHPDITANLNLMVRQKPNKKSLFWRSFRLDWYNFLGGDQHEIRGNWVSRNYYRSKNWMARTIGTPPVIFNPKYNLQSVEMMTNYMKGKGYYFAQVSDTVVVDSIWLFRQPKVKVLYRVRPGKPYRINKMQYDVQDEYIRKFVEQDSVNRVFQSGELFDAGVLQAERQRLADSLKNRGYYKFAKEYIYYTVDKVPNELRWAAVDSSKSQKPDTAAYDLVDLTMRLKPYEERIRGRNVVFNSHPLFMIDQVYINPNYDPQLAIREGADYYNGLDTNQVNNVLFLQKGKPGIRYSTLARGLDYQGGELYTASKIAKTTQYLNTLSAVKLASSYFSEKETTYESDTVNDLRVRHLNSHLNVTHATRQSYSIDFEGNYASKEYFGIDGSLNYQHKNLFKGSENFTLVLSTSWANNKYISSGEDDGRNLFNTVQYGADANLEVPKFFIPAGFRDFSKKYTPQTNFGLGFSFERRPDFSNQNANASFGYRWRTSPKKNHFLNPLHLFATQIINISEAYRQDLSNRNLLADFSDKIIPAVNYTFVYNGKPEGVFDSYSFLQTRIESAGNLLVAGLEALGAQKHGNEFFDGGEYSMYHFLDLPIAQYVQADVDLRLYQVIDPEQKIVYRIFAGAGVPYGNFPALPSHKQYISGGMNSLRGWSPGYIGPGNFSYDRVMSQFQELRALGIDSAILTNRQQRGELKLEFNLEYRLKVGDMLETAFFVDAGNNWTLSDYNASAQLAARLNRAMDAGQIQGKRYQTAFQPNTFYKQLAYNTGIGLRFDMSFFVLRLDLGAKLHDPGNEESGIFKSGFFRLDNWRLNFGIGHPF